MVNYPNRMKPRQSVPQSPNHQTSFANRGMSFEAAINATNDFYLAKGLAVIHKKPTPIQIVKVDYPQRSRAKIVEAYFRQASTTDYSGVYRGHYIDFEAKETQQKKAFPLKNFHAHQLKHMELVLAQQGICFVLLHFTISRETFLLPATALLAYLKSPHGTKSIPLDYIKKNGYIIELGAFPQVPYLDIIEKNLLGGDSHKNNNQEKYF